MFCCVNILSNSSTIVAGGSSVATVAMLGRVSLFGSDHPIGLQFFFLCWCLLLFVGEEEAEVHLHVVWKTHNLDEVLFHFLHPRVVRSVPDPHTDPVVVVHDV